jgi:hypothetical protein
MGMDMVPVYEGEQSGVKIDPTTLQNISVRYSEAAEFARCKGTFGHQEGWNLTSGPLLRKY